jgi:hypothetical protein
MCMRLEQGGVVLKRSRLGALRSHLGLRTCSLGGSLWISLLVSPPIRCDERRGSGDRQNQTH